MMVVSLHEQMFRELAGCAASLTVRISSGNATSCRVLRMRPSAYDEDPPYSRRSALFVTTGLAKGLSLQDQLRRAVDALPGLVWTARPNGDIDFLNQRWCEYTGLSTKRRLAGDGRRRSWSATPVLAFRRIFCHTSSNGSVKPIAAPRANTAALVSASQSSAIWSNYMEAPFTWPAAVAIRGRHFV